MRQNSKENLKPEPEPGFYETKHMIAITESLRLELEKVKADNARLRSMSTIEMMCENLNVRHHVEEWERRCLKAESELDRLRGIVK